MSFNNGRSDADLFIGENDWHRFTDSYWRSCWRLGRRYTQNYRYAFHYDLNTTSSFFHRYWDSHLGTLSINHPWVEDDSDGYVPPYHLHERTSPSRNARAENIIIFAQLTHDYSGKSYDTNQHN